MTALPHPHRVSLSGLNMVPEVPTGNCGKSVGQAPAAAGISLGLKGRRATLSQLFEWQWNQVGPRPAISADKWATSAG